MLTLIDLRSVITTCLYSLMATSISNAVFAADLTATPLKQTTNIGYIQSESYPGGEATSKNKVNKQSFSHPSANLSEEKKLPFRVGRAFFKRIWVSSPASTTSSDGLGPLFNAKSCMRCHINNGRGHTPSFDQKHQNAVSMVLKLSIDPITEEQKELIASHKLSHIAEPTYGGQLQEFAVQGLKAEGRFKINYTDLVMPLADGTRVTLRQPSYLITDLKYGPLSPNTLISPRVAPQMIGMGLLELIPEKTLSSLADPLDQDQDGISGKTNKVWDPLLNKVSIGRFGWKAGMPSLAAQNADAFKGDIGLSTPLHPEGHGDCTIKQTNCLKAPTGNNYEKNQAEVNQKVSDLVELYTQHLAVPARRDPKGKHILKGKALFYEANCVKCHTPSHITASSSKNPELSEQTIWPYTDLLLHDMGKGLADNRPEGEANGQEWRTPPLWGIGLTNKISGHSQLLHDGRARNVLEAILWHDGEAKKSREAVVNMSSKQRQLLIQFVESL